MFLFSVGTLCFTAGIQNKSGKSSINSHEYKESQSLVHFFVLNLMSVFNPLFLNTAAHTHTHTSPNNVYMTCILNYTKGDTPSFYLTSQLTRLDLHGERITDNVLLLLLPCVHLNKSQRFTYYSVLFNTRRIILRNTSMSRQTFGKTKQKPLNRKTVAYSHSTRCVI